MKAVPVPDAVSGDANDGIPEVSKTKSMVVALSGMMEKKQHDSLKNLHDRVARLSTFYIHQASENVLKSGVTCFHDFLNRESYKPETKRSSLSNLPYFNDESASRSGGSPGNPKIIRKTLKEEEPGCSSNSSKVSENQSMQDLFGVLSVTRDDMKSKTPMQLVEFVKQVESNQRREAFEKQQRPAYLLKLARTQSVDRARLYGDVARAVHRAVDRVNDDGNVTDSSSGGESADEAEEETFPKTFDAERLVPINQRALYRYAVSRHEVASRYGFAHRRLARTEYGYQVVGNLIQRLQQKQSVAVFGDLAADDCKPLIKPPAPLHKGVTPRCWDDRDVSTITKTSNAVTFLRLPTPKSNIGQSLHVGKSVFSRKRPKVVLPGTGLTYPFENYEATMWKERLSFGRTILRDSDLEDVDLENGGKELTEAVVSSARGCARARPLVSFRKRIIVRLDSYPPKRYQLEEKPRQCDCYTRSLSPTVAGPSSCALCMGLLPIPSWTVHTSLLRMPRNEAAALIDHGYHPRLSNASTRALDLELSGVSVVDFDPATLSALAGPFRVRPSRRAQALQAVKREADIARLARRKEEARSGKNALRASLNNGLEGISSKRIRSKTVGTVSSVGRNRNQRKRTKSVRGKKRRRSSSDVSASSGASTPTRSTSVASDDKADTKRPGKALSKAISQKRRHDGHADSNFVIPYGMTAPSKIEKIQYKEIIVPKFRDLKCGSLPSPGLSNGFRGHDNHADTISSDSETSLEEDMSDAAFIERHSRCEVEERTRFSLPEKNTRKRNAAAEGNSGTGGKKRKNETGPLERRRSGPGSSRRQMTHFGRNDPRKRSSTLSKIQTAAVESPSVEEKPVEPVFVVPSDPPLPSPRPLSVAVRRPRQAPETLASSRPVRTRKSTYKL